MHSYEDFILELGDLELFQIDSTHISMPKENLFIVSKTNWDYLVALDFQMKCVEIVQKFTYIKVFIFTSHPNCFTVGKGLQRSMVEEAGLVEFDESNKNEISIPIHKIKRGGGITFHQPGQVVFYPIIHLNHQKLKVFDFIELILRATKTTLENLWNLEHIDIDNSLLGLWIREKKLASIGLHLKRFVTCHGMALNLWKDPTMWQEIMKVHPCGLSPTTYNSIQDKTKNTSSLEVENKREQFVEGFLQCLNKSF
ncbi:lipoyl(octanoyl) transferase [Halobacteriovorax marinus]|uniref:Octanoyltransferase n=1 Tax=Halobacteriovorax marinus TaxID=97084 RepID=A0A1Y5F4E4_9BACT|nr:lipoyl(octanoyl) transferase [Halobacteriovorax marinus]